MNKKSRNVGKYYKAVSQITLHTLHCNLIVGFPKPKHVATILKESNFSNYSVMSECLSQFTRIFPRLTIYRAVQLTSCYLSCYARTFRKCLPTFRMVAITSTSRSISQRRVHITIAEILTTKAAKL